MGDVEILLEEDGNLKVVKHNNIRFLLRRLLGEDRQRRLVVRWRNCRQNCRQNCQDHTFLLKCLFVLLLLYLPSSMLSGPLIIKAMTVSFNLHTFDETGIPLSYQLLCVGILLVALFVFGLLMKTMSAPPLRKEEIKSIFGRIQHL